MDFSTPVSPNPSSRSQSALPQRLIIRTALLWTSASRNSLDVRQAARAASSGAFIAIRDSLTCSGNSAPICPSDEKRHVLAARSGRAAEPIIVAIHNVRSHSHRAREGKASWPPDALAVEVEVGQPDLKVVGARWSGSVGEGIEHPERLLTVEEDRFVLLVALEARRPVGLLAPSGVSRRNGHGSVRSCIRRYA